MSLFGFLRGEQQSPIELDIDDVLDLLDNERRRLMIDVLAEESHLTLRELAKRVAATEYDTTPDRLDHDQYKRVYISILQHHVTMFADAGLIDRYDHDLSPTEEVDGMARVLETVREEVNA